MPDKSYVSLESKICPICHVEHQHNCDIILDTRLRESFDRTTVTGFELCEKHDTKIKEGFFFLVGVDPEKSQVKDGSILAEDVCITGSSVGIKKEVLNEIFSDEFRSTLSTEVGFTYVDDELLNNITEHLQEIMEEND